MRKNQTEIDKATIMFLSKRLPKASEDAMRFLLEPFAHTLAFSKVGKKAAQADTLWCAHCGGIFNRSELTDIHQNPDWNRNNYYQSRRWIATCPHCGKPMQIICGASRERKLEDVVGFSATMGEWRIDRFYISTEFCKIGQKSETQVHEIAQRWTHRDGNVYHYCSPKGGLYYSKFWRWYAPWRFVEQSPECDNDWWNGEERYDTPADFSLDKELTMRGISLDALHGLKLTQILRYMNDDSHFETLWKQGDWEIAKFFKKDLSWYWPQIRIARNHGYKIDNLTEWKDLISLLRGHHKDIRNPKFICPANLHEAHQAELTEAERRERIRQEIWRREADERHRREAEEAMKTRAQKNEEYIKRMQKYFDISIPANGFTIVVLQSIDDFEREGSMLKHCVFRCGYYQHANSLILSARDKDNNPIETIEVNLQSFQIAQCYGLNDTYTPMHKAILKAMNENMWRVKEVRLAS